MDRRTLSNLHQEIVSLKKDGEKLENIRSSYDKQLTI